MAEFKGLVTGIGSLPYREAGEALDLIFKFTPEVPFWPQLPKRDMKEGMVAQFSERLPCLEMGPDGLFFNAAGKERMLEIFYDRVIANDVDFFKITRPYAFGLYEFYRRLEETDLGGVSFIKGQTAGPFTFAASIIDENGLALLHDKVFFQAVTTGLLMKALWQIKLFKKFGKKMLFFIDEPYLGCFGSAYTPINREDVTRNLKEFASGIRSQDTLVGLHCCGNTDWSIFTDIDEIDVISFDAFGFMDKFALYADNLNSFLKRGGVICWGIVPTQEFSQDVTADSLKQKLDDALTILERKGIEKELLLRQMLLSPSCGLGNLDMQKAQGIFGLLPLISSLMRKTA